MPAKDWCSYGKNFFGVDFFKGLSYPYCYEESLEDQVEIYQFLCTREKEIYKGTRSRNACKYRKGTSIRQAPVFRHLRALRKSPWKFIICMNELYLHCMLLVSYIQQYFNTSITVLTNQVYKLLIALFKVPNIGAFTGTSSRNACILSNNNYFHPLLFVHIKTIMNR